MDGLVDVCLVRVIISSYFNWSWLNPARAVRRRESSEHVKCRLAEVSQAEPHGFEMNHKIFSIESTTHDSKPEKKRSTHEASGKSEPENAESMCHQHHVAHWQATRSESAKSTIRRYSNRAVVTRLHNQAYAHASDATMWRVERRQRES